MKPSSRSGRPFPGGLALGLLMGAASAAAAGLAGCGLAIIQTTLPLEAGKAGPSPGPYLLADVRLSPPVAQRFVGGGVMVVDLSKFPQKDHMALLVTPDLRPIPWEKAGLGQALRSTFFGYNPYGGDAVYVRTNGPSVVPTTPGVHFIRWGTYFVDSQCTVMAVGSTPGCRVTQERYVNNYHDIRVTVPTGAKVVYIGRILMYHQNDLVTRIEVSNDLPGALPTLRAMNIPGVTAADVKVQLAQVLGSSSR